MHKVQYPERVLIVLNEDGTLKAAHVERQEKILEDDGSLYLTKQLPAEALTEQTLAEVFPDQAVLASQVIALQTQITTLESQLESKETA